MSLLEIRKLSYVYPGVQGVVALNEVDFDVAENEFVSIIGPSGCGKSTLLRLIADLLPVTTGSVLIDGELARVARIRRDIGFVFQEAALMPWRSSIRNVRLPMEVIKPSGLETDGRGARWKTFLRSGDNGRRPTLRQRWQMRAERRRILDPRSQELLALVGLSGFEGKRPDQLSGGMRQRVSIARALTYSPRLLLMDEPFGALDQITRDEMNGELLHIWETERSTVLFVTHSISEAIYLSDRVVVLSARPGTIVDIVDVPLPRPRDVSVKRSPHFFETETKLLAALEGRSGHG